MSGWPGTLFAVWAPNAKAVSVIGDFNDWAVDRHPLRARRDGSGIWEGFVPGAGHGDRYKYYLRSHYDGFEVAKGDPFALRWETPPQTASIVWDPAYEWQDEAWMSARARHNALDAPMSIYEVHLGSWRLAAEEAGRFLSCRELAGELTDYIQHMGYTHVELLPVMEHPFYGSWGYQTTGLFAPTARYGDPQDFMYLIDELHRRGIAVILDWVPSHFPSDEHGLVYFDATYLFEHADPKRGFHPDWNSYIYNYGRNAVRAILISSAMFWLDRYHADGLRVDAVASMLYLDYGRKAGEWIPNEHGGNEDLDAVTFLRRLNESVDRELPDRQTIAEESTAWPGVSRPAYLGGLGFGMKWKMGWLHDTVSYFGTDPLYRRHHQDKLTFGIWYAFSENYVLPLSHDEVVHGKGSLLARMPGDTWQRLANLRALLAYMYAHPGKKLLFMGGEIGQWSEWRHNGALDWHLLESAEHRGIQAWVRDLNHLYRDEPALHQLDFEPAGFEWVDFQDVDNSVVSFLRWERERARPVLAVFNLTPLPRQDYRVGVPREGWWREMLNSDAPIYGGSGQGNYGGAEAEAGATQGQDYGLRLTLPPLAAVFLGPGTDQR